MGVGGVGARVVDVFERRVREGAAAAVDAAAAATARRDLGVDGASVVEEIVAPALRHRSSKVRVEALRALTRMSPFVDARVVAISPAGTSANEIISLRSRVIRLLSCAWSSSDCVEN